MTFSLVGRCERTGMMGVAITTSSIALDGKPVCDVELTFRIMDFPNSEMRDKMREMAALVGFPAEVPANG